MQLKHPQALKFQKTPWVFKVNLFTLQNKREFKQTIFQLQQQFNSMSRTPVPLLLLNQTFLDQLLLIMGI